MAFNVITFLQFVVFVAIVFNINIHLTSAGSKQPSAHNSSVDSIKAEFCKTNCTKGSDGAWSVCSEDCLCVRVGNSTAGRCMNLVGDYDYPTKEAEE
uniref:Putative secreted protein n=1 Tax=Ixodes ricinus TaxID=34613 RepID=A0A090X978_IXORI